MCRSLRERLKDGSIGFMEVAIRNRRMTVAIAASDGEGLAAHLSDYIAGLEFLRSQGKALRESFDVMAPARGDIPSLSAAQLAEPHSEALAADAVLAFALVALLHGRADPTSVLAASAASKLGSQFPAKAAIERLQGAARPLGPLDEAVADAVALIRSGTHVEPRALWEIGLRFFVKARQSNFRALLLPLLGNWLRTQWQRIIVSERSVCLDPC
jgi:hypothetical protein